MRMALAITMALGLGLMWAPATSLAVGCCMCTGCVPPPAIACFTTAGNSGDCNEDCENCATQLFDPAGVCGVGAFAPCAGGPAVVAPAPALGGPGLAVATILLLGAGLLRLARRRASR